MLFKTSSLAVLAAAAATVCAQTGVPNHTFFTSPVGEGISYVGGEKEVFSWQKACTAGDSTSMNALKTEVHLVNSNNINSAFYVDTITTIDCSKDQGNTEWVVPVALADGVTNYALKIILSPTPAYSGNFKITTKGGSSGGGSSPGGAPT
ncbi:hypothetical protein BGZ65_008729, partial [Modicella reniformis]